MKIYKIAQFDKDKELIELSLNDLILVKSSINGALYDVSTNRGSQTEEEIEVWQVKDKYVIVDGWHRFVELALKGIIVFAVQVVGRGYSDYWVTEYNNNEVYSTEDFIEAINEYTEN